MEGASEESRDRPTRISRYVLYGMYSRYPEFDGTRDPAVGRQLLKQQVNGTVALLLCSALGTGGMFANVPLDLIGGITGGKNECFRCDWKYSFD